VRSSERRCVWSACHHINQSKHRPPAARIEPETWASRLSERRWCSLQAGMSAVDFVDGSDPNDLAELEVVKLFAVGARPPALNARYCARV
jgi:hypothetical protein